MIIKESEFLIKHKSLLKKIVIMLSKTYQYVSILGTDTIGKDFNVSKTEIKINDNLLVERGFVIRVYNGINYSEYSFNELNETNLQSIVNEINSKISKDTRGKCQNKYPKLIDQKIVNNFIGEVKENPEEIGLQVILNDLIDIKNAALSYSKILINFIVSYSFIHVSKIFISNKKELEQSYIIGEAYMYSLVQIDNKKKYYYKPYSGMLGYEILDRLKKDYKDIIDQSIRLLSAVPAIPGKYDVICSPEITGLIAHEAFGHGVEMDMFVKQRAKAASYVGKKVASSLITMHDGATATQHVSTYLFDDEGTIGSDTIIIRNGILENGISDLLSAINLNTIPTGNGKRESFERKSYARMTNTYIEAGKDRYEDILSSIKYGYQLEGIHSGMEDPKNWGIQCIAQLGREIKDGKFTGKLISPVNITGYVPDLLKSISMISNTVEFEGSGYCGKGHKEYVKTSCGGPYIKTKVRLG